MKYESRVGLTLSGRNFTLSGGAKSRYGFQGQEKDDEIKGEGNSINYTYRMHDPRLGRFFAVDPLAKEYPELTPYQFSSNRVIDYIELEGLEGTKAAAYNAYVFSEGFSDAVYSNNIQLGYGREKAEELYPNNLYAQRTFIRGQMAGDVASLVSGGIIIDMGLGALGTAGTLAVNVEGAPITEPAALATALAGVISVGTGTVVITNATTGLVSGLTQYNAVNKKIEEKEKELQNDAKETAAKGGTRSLDDLSSLRGATWKEAESLIPKGWTRGPMNKGEGIKFVNPAKKGEQILLEKGWPGAKDPLHAGPYMKISRNGTVERIPLQGNPTLK